MNQDFVFNNSGTPNQAYVSPHDSCVSATPEHRFSSVQRPQFTLPSTSNNRGRHATPCPYYLPQTPAKGAELFNSHKQWGHTAA
jgi:hypothetical protein